MAKRAYTFARFLKEVKALKLRWRKNEASMIRCAKGYCPIIALYNSKYPDDLLANSWYEKAAKKLRIPIAMATKIVDAADDCTGMSNLYRKRLIETLIPAKRAKV